ncbi:MAG: hypothetical protein DHS20C17_05620 [Cyclobacteriaceae bacterium]|nr:MAG: hypothetical protein DHS20C17_05620 [Cyclobacteriaceae bacterium]
MVSVPEAAWYMRVLENLLTLGMAFAIGCAVNPQNSEKGLEHAILWDTIAPYFTPPAQYKGQYGSFRSPLKFYNGDTVTTPQEWKQRRSEIYHQWESMLGKWPPLITDPSFEIIETVYRESFTQHLIRFFWTPNEQTTGYLLIPDGEGKTRGSYGLLRA